MGFGASFGFVCGQCAIDLIKQLLEKRYQDPNQPNGTQTQKVLDALQLII
jgi:hypothetical protein